MTAKKNDTQESGAIKETELELQVEEVLSSVMVGQFKDRPINFDLQRNGLHVAITYAVMSEANAGNKALSEAGFSVEKSKANNPHVFNARRPAKREAKSE